MPFSFLLVALFKLVAYLAPVVAVAGLLCLTRPHRRELGARLLRGGAAGAVAGAVVSAVIGALSGDAPTARGLLAATGFGFTVAATAIALVHARRSPRPADAA